MIMEYIGKLFLYHTGFVSSAFKSAIYTTSIFWRKKTKGFCVWFANGSRFAF